MKYIVFIFTYDICKIFFDLESYSTKIREKKRICKFVQKFKKKVILVLDPQIEGPMKYLPTVYPF